MNYRPRTFVPGGPTSVLETCKIAGVGEQPGKEEIVQRKCFVGPAGEELDEDFRVAGIHRPEVYLTNCIKDLDKPLAAYLKRRKHDYVMSDEAMYYQEMLRSELAGCSANVIIAIGAPALWFLCNRIGILNWRGSILESTLLPGRKVVPIIHPATVIPPKNVYTNKRLIIMDLIRAKEESESPAIRYQPRNTIIRPSFYQTLEYLNKAYHKGLSGETIVIDLELTPKTEELSCIGISWKSDEGMCIPFLDHSGDYFTIDQETAVWLALGKILEDERILKWNQNIGFEAQMFLRRYGIKCKNLQCLMIAQRLILPDYKVGLEFPTSLFTDIPYYKQDGKKWFKIGGAWETLWNYNGLDVMGPHDIRREQFKYLKQQDNEETFYEQCRLIEPLTYMQEKGIRVDVDGMKQEYYRCVKEAEVIDEKIKSLVGWDINTNSPQQLMDYFYRKRNIKPYKTRNTSGKWVETSNEEALVRIGRRSDVGEAADVAKLVLKYRRLVKRSSTYVPVNEGTGELRKVDSDGRLRCSYNAAGTKTGRLSSSEDIFGSGMDMQNWPHDLLSFLLPDPGYIYYALDESQIENRIVAYVGGITEMIEAFEALIDVHKKTAAMIFRKPIEEVSDEPGSCWIGSGEFSERFWGKKGNHAFNYDFGYRSFALKYEIPESDAKWIYNAYHNAYPGVREGYHTYVQHQLRVARKLVNLLGRTRVFLGKLDNYTFKDAYAQIPQSTAADVINQRGVNYVYYDQDQFADLELLIQIHDSIGFQLPVSIGFEEHARMIIAIKRNLEQPLKFKEREFVVPADLTMGLTLNKNDGVEFKRFTEDRQELAKLLKESYEALLKTQPGVPAHQ